MATAQPQPPKPDYFNMTETEYLEFEEQSEIRHEFVNGKVYAMAGADWNHVMIVQSTSNGLYNQLRGNSCRVGTNDLRLKVTSKKVSYRYPDMMVICGEPNFIDNRKTIDNPTVIIEVLSPSTAVEDRNSKLDEYRQLVSVQHYLIIAQDEAKIQHFSRDSHGKWLYDSVSGVDATLELPAINCKLKLANVYEEVDWTSDETQQG